MTSSETMPSAGTARFARVASPPIQSIVLPDSSGTNLLSVALGRRGGVGIRLAAIGPDAEQQSAERVRAVLVQDQRDVGDEQRGAQRREAAADRYQPIRRRQR